MHSSTLLALCTRVTIALCTRTFFQPDEYFQALEPAHNAVFGYGDLTWEWTISKPIRSIIYPALNMPLYWLLKVSGMSEMAGLGDFLLIVLPRILHGCLAACTDIYAGKTAQKLLGTNYSSTTVFVSLTSLFHALSLSRSLSNSLETSLCTVAFSFYPWEAISGSPQFLHNRLQLRKAILFSALACIIRPTNAIIWVYLYCNLLWAVRSNGQVVVKIAVELLVAGFLGIAFIFTTDSIYYGTPTMTPLNFLKRNMSSVSLFYGINDWHYYITQGIPILCTTALPFVLHGIWTTVMSHKVIDAPLKTVLATIVCTTTVYSFAGHKEWRFIHPILPLLHIFASKSLASSSSLIYHDKKQTRSDHEKPSTTNKAQKLNAIHNLFHLPPIPLKYLIFVLLSVPISLYAILGYCSAPISAVSYIHSIPKEQLNTTTIGVIMPCHSLPGQAYIHRKELARGRMWSLGCEPPLDGQELSSYKDQTDVFFDSPIDYFNTYFPLSLNTTFPMSPFPASLPGTTVHPSSTSNQATFPWRHEWPTHFILFGELLEERGIRSLFEKQGYTQVWKAGRDWEGEGKRKGGVVVWKWSV